ncbi:MAG: hypothetical protein U0175_35885 [Caldilineaceae bacterium]
MAQQLCPYLATLDQNFNQGPPVDYPSFENRCLASGEQDSLLFPHQATFCLSSGHRMCPLFKAARHSAGRIGKRQEATGWQPVRPAQASVGEPNTPNGGLSPRKNLVPSRDLQSASHNQPVEASTQFVPADGNLQHSGVLSAENNLAEEDWLEGRRRWGWIGAGVVFVVVLIFGGLTAAWAGWTFANAQLESPPGAVSVAEVLPTIGATPESSAFVVWTATPSTGSVPAAVGAAPAVPMTQTQKESFEYPVAVTATPGAPIDNSANNGTNSSQNNGEAPLIVVQPPESQPVQVPPGGQQLPDINVEIPTRRPTPPPDVAVDANGQVIDTPTATQTPTPLGTPVVIFGPDDKILKPGECTTVRWSVQNVHEVYYENLGVNGQGEREECIRSHDGIYSLRVILPSGETQIYTTTVTIEQPTPTPTVTETFTPEPYFTPTWTPIPPTATATPNIRRGVSMSVQGDANPKCSANSNCAIGLLVSNTGDQIDNLTVQKQSGSEWSGQLCRSDGVCGDQLTLVSVGPGNTVFLELRLIIPADASAGQKNSYQFMATSDGSGGMIGVGPMVVEVVIQ